MKYETVKIEEEKPSFTGHVPIILSNGLFKTAWFDGDNFDQISPKPVFWLKELVTDEVSSGVRLSLPTVIEARQEANDNYDDGERWTAFVRGATWVMIEANKRKGSEA